MSLQRLRRILGSSFFANVDSSERTVNRVAQLAEARRQSLINANKVPPRVKPPQVVPELQTVPRFGFRAIDVLRKIGELTTPQWTNMAILSSSWATGRYFWAIADGDQNPYPFRLSGDCRDLDFHQKTLMSDEFGVGFSGLALERLFRTNAWVDVSVALADRQRFQDIRRQGRLQPDFLMWEDAPGSPYFIVESKGSQTDRSVSMDQIRRGLEQLPAIRFGGIGRAVRRVVVATLLQTTSTTVYIIDPEDEETEEERDKRLLLEDSKATSERLSKNVWFVPDPENFEVKASESRSVQILNWAGQYRSATELETRIELAPPTRPPMEDRPLISRDIGEYRFDGFRVPLFPELGDPHVNLFIGVEHEIIETARRDQANARTVLTDRSEQLARMETEDHNGRISVGPSGTVLAVEGLD